MVYLAHVCEHCAEGIHTNEFNGTSIKIVNHIEGKTNFCPQQLLLRLVVRGEPECVNRSCVD